MSNLKLLFLGIALAASSAAQAQIKLTPVERTGAASGPATDASAKKTAAAAPCKPKKKGFGLGGILKAAKDSGLGSMVAGKVGGGFEGAMAATAAHSAVDAVAAAEKSAAAAPAKC